MSAREQVEVLLLSGAGEEVRALSYRGAGVCNIE